MKAFFKSRTIQATLLAGIFTLLGVLLQSKDEPALPPQVSEFSFAPIYSQQKSAPPVAALGRARCFFSSVISNRPDAFRCAVEGGQFGLYDPCFEDPIDPEILSCPTDPDNFEFFLASSTELKGVVKTKKEPNQPTPWHLRLADGTECFALGGTTVVVAGARLDFQCDSDSSYAGLSLPIQKNGESATINCYQGSRLGECFVKEIWY